VRAHTTRTLLCCCRYVHFIQWAFCTYASLCSLPYRASPPANILLPALYGSSSVLRALAYVASRCAGSWIYILRCVVLVRYLRTRHLVRAWTTSLQYKYLLTLRCLYACAIRACRSPPFYAALVFIVSSACVAGLHFPPYFADDMGRRLPPLPASPPPSHHPLYSFASCCACTTHMRCCRLAALELRGFGSRMRFKRLGGRRPRYHALRSIASPSYNERFFPATLARCPALPLPLRRLNILPSWDMLSAYSGSPGHSHCRNGSDGFSAAPPAAVFLSLHLSACCLPQVAPCFLLRPCSYHFLLLSLVCLLCRGTYRVLPGVPCALRYREPFSLDVRKADGFCAVWLARRTACLRPTVGGTLYTRATYAWCFCCIRRHSVLPMERTLTVPLLFCLGRRTLYWLVLWFRRSAVWSLTTPCLRAVLLYVILLYTILT